MINFSETNILNLTFNSFLKGKMALIYLALAKEGNTPIASYNEIAMATGYTKKTVIETIKALESCGLLIKLKWNSRRGENDANCYILFSPDDLFKRNVPNEKHLQYIARALNQIEASRDGKPIVEPWLSEMINDVKGGVKDTPQDRDTQNGTDNKGNKIKTAYEDGVKSIPPYSNVRHDDDLNKANDLQQHQAVEKEKATFSTTPNVVVNPSTSIAKFLLRKKTYSPWVRFIMPGEKVNKNEIIVNLNDYFNVDLTMAVVNATQERINQALEAVVEYAQKTAIRNLQGILVKAITCGWTVGKKVFIAKKKDNHVVRQNLYQEEGRDKYRDLYRLTPQTC